MWPNPAYEYEERPIAFFDLETTGTDPATDKIVEISVLRIDPGGGRASKTRRLNPERRIPPDATSVHGISDEDVASAPTFRQIAKGLLEFISDSDLAGFNVLRFDLPLLEREFRDCGLDLGMTGRRVIDAMAVYHRKEPRDLAAAARARCERAESANRVRHMLKATHVGAVSDDRQRPALEDRIDERRQDHPSRRRLPGSGHVEKPGDTPVAALLTEIQHDLFGDPLTLGIGCPRPRAVVLRQRALLGERHAPAEPSPGGGEVVDLTAPLNERIQRYPTDPGYRRSWHVTFADAGMNVSKLEMGAHIGTHVDAPLHFIDGAKDITQLDPGCFVGPALAIDCPCVLQVAFWRERDIQRDDDGDPSAPVRFLQKPFEVRCRRQLTHGRR